MVTDPPYGVDYDAAWRNSELDQFKPSVTGRVKNDTRSGWADAYALHRGDVIYVWMASSHLAVAHGDLLGLGFEVRIYC